MFNKKLPVFLFSLLGICLFHQLTLAGHVFARQQYLIKFATVAPESSTWMKHMRALDKELREKSDGRLGFRFYAGGGYIFHKEPSGLDPWSTQAGLEFRSPRLWLNGSLRPVAGIDVQNRQESNWSTDVSARAGIQFENPDFLSRKLQLLFGYYNGKSPNGQFYESNIEFFSLGLHFFLD